MTKEQYELLVKQNLLARQRAAEMGQVVSTGGIDLSTGQRPAFKFGPIEIGDATDYGQLSDSVLADTAAINRSLIEAGEAKAEEERKTSDQRMADLIKQTSTGNIQDSLEALRQYRLNTRDLDRQEADEAVNRSVVQSQMQMAAAMPFLDMAGQRATERNLNASQRFLAFKEGQPTAIQNRMLMSSSAYAQNLNAVANAATAAANMARSGTGRRFG